MGRSRRKDVSCEGDGLADEADRDVESNRGVREAVNRRQLALLSVERTFMREEWHAFFECGWASIPCPDGDVRPKKDTTEVARLY